jgi:ABC transport system ATP-binding/permease protein
LPAEKRDTPAKTAEALSKPAKKTKLSFAEARELEQLPAKIDALDVEAKTLHAFLADPAAYQNASLAARVRAAQKRIGEIEAASAEAMARWEVLAAKESAVDVQ